MSIINTNYNLKTKFDFGKHKGLSVQEVIDINPQYILWADENVGHVTFTLACIRRAEVSNNKRRAIIEKSRTKKKKKYLSAYYSAEDDWQLAMAYGILPWGNS